MLAVKPLATIEDVQRLGVDVSNTDLVGFLLEAVSDGVRAAAGTPITRAEVSLVREGTWDQDLLLPGAPIRAVHEVLIEGRPVSDWRLRGNRLWRNQGWVGEQVDVQVRYEYGLDEAPADIVKLVATLVAAGVNEAADGPASTRGLAYVSVDDYREGYRQGEAEVVDLTEVPERTRQWLQARFSGGAAVIGSL